jgi:putative FmdB family regulatory protein
VPRYEYRCRECAVTFEVSRPMAESARPAPCPAGHPDSVRLLSTVALTGSGAAFAGGQAPWPAAGCCGGACGCG